MRVLIFLTPIATWKEFFVLFCQQYHNYHATREGFVQEFGIGEANYVWPLDHGVWVCAPSHKQGVFSAPFVATLAAKML